MRGFACSFVSSRSRWRSPPAPLPRARGTRCPSIPATTRRRSASRRWPRPPRCRSSGTARSTPMSAPIPSRAAGSPPTSPRWSRSAATWSRASTRLRPSPGPLCRRGARRQEPGRPARRPRRASLRGHALSRRLPPALGPRPGRPQGRRGRARGPAVPAGGRRGGGPPEPARHARDRRGRQLRAPLAQGGLVPRLPAPGARHHGPGRPPGRRGALPAPRHIRL